VPKVELEGCIFRRGYAEEGVAWLGGGILLIGRCGGAVLYGHPAESESQRSPAGLCRKTRDRGRDARCGALVLALRVTLVLLPRELLLESGRGSP
jgi:hypothetical protein